MKYILISLILGYSFYGVCQNKNVLILGNSLMSYNKMPETLQSFLDLNDKNVTVDQFTRYGGNLAGYIDDYDFGRNKSINLRKQKYYLKQGRSAEKLKAIWKYDFDVDTINHSTLEQLLLKKTYDVIFVQEHGSIIDSDLGLKYKGFKSLERFYKLIPKTTDVIYFSEYPNKKIMKSNKTEETSIHFYFYYDTLSCYPLSKIDSLNLGSNNPFLYDTLIIKNNATERNDHTVVNLKKLKTKFPISIAPTAYIFTCLKQKYPNLKMYRMRGHPSAKASYLFANVYYYMITGEFNKQKDKLYRFKISDKNKKRIQDEVIKYFNDLHLNERSQ